MCTVFDSNLSSVDEVLSINQSADVFVFEDSNVHHKDWLTFPGGTNRPGELCYNFSISNDLTQMVNCPTRIPGCDCHTWRKRSPYPELFWSAFFPDFPAFRLNMERYSRVRIQGYSGPHFSQIFLYLD